MHASLDVRGALSAARRFPGLVPGKRVADRREWLLDRLGEGKRYLPLGDPCDGYSYETGCPGHEEG
jgi:hypothetical protein